MEDQLHVRHEVLDIFILMVFQLILNCRKVHWVLDDIRIVGYTQSDIVHRVAEDVRPLISLKSREDTLGCFFPLVEDWGSFRHFWYLQFG